MRLRRMSLREGALPPEPCREGAAVLATVNPTRHARPYGLRVAQHRSRGWPAAKGLTSAARGGQADRMVRMKE